MIRIRRRQIGSALILLLIVITSSFVALSLSPIEWPFASGFPLSLNPKPPSSGQGVLLINASYFFNGFQNPMVGATISLFQMPKDQQLAENVTSSNGTLEYALRQGSYLITLSSPEGVAADTVKIFADYTTVFNYVSVNQTIAALSFDVMTQQPGFVAPWDRVYVELPNLFSGLNITSINTFIVPVYSGAGSTILNESSVVNTNQSSTRIPHFPKRISVTGVFQVQAAVLSEQVSPSGLSWLQLKPEETFPVSGLLGLVIFQYNSTFTVTVYKNAR